MLYDLSEEMPHFSPEISNTEDVLIGLAASKLSNVDKQLVGHAFGLAIELTSGRQIEAVAFSSPNTDSNESRGYLGGVITATQWLRRWAPQSPHWYSYSRSSYLYDYLYKNMGEWIREDSSRPNMDLIKLISELKDSGRMPYLCKAASKKHLSLVKRASDAAKKLTGVNTDSRRFLYEDDNDDLYRRALEKDP